MDEIALTPLALNDAPALMRFEAENRAWFETWVPPRPDGYWQIDTLEAIIRDRLRNADALFLVRRGATIVGRLNLTRIANGTAQLGYRIGRVHCRQGLATQAVLRGLDAARGLRLETIEAKVKPDNPASARVLEKTGFRLTTTERDFRYYRRRLDSAPPDPQILSERRRA